MKTCKACGEAKPLTEYHVAPGYSGGYKPQCKPCYLSYQKEQRKKLTPEIRRSYWVKHKYGITLQEQHQMLADQHGVCAICLHPMERMCVDHDHSTGVVRALLCTPCNTGLGAFKENPDSLANAIRYLERF